MSTLTAPRTPAQSRCALLGLAALFFAPLGLAFVIYYGSGGRWRPAGTVNHGTLIIPARPTPELELPLLVAGPVAAATAASAPLQTRPDFLEHRWTLLYEGAGRCEAYCQRALTTTRQARLALNRDTPRVQRVFLAQGACCDRDYFKRLQPDLIVVGESDAALPLRALLPGAGSDRVYLIDPLGNLMMWYAPGSGPRDIVSDLKRVLGVSHVG
jgi:hypothetical protein